MASISEGITVEGGSQPGGDLSDSQFDAYLASQVGKTESDNGQPDSQHEERRREFEASPDEIRAAMADDDNRVSNTIESGLTVKTHEPAEKTGRQLADEALANLEKFKETDPGFERAAQANLDAHNFAAYAHGDSVELHATALSNALVESEGDYTNAQVIATARKLADISPEGYAAFLETMDEQVYAAADELGLDPFSDEYPTDEAMPSAVLGQRVRQMIDTEQALDEREHLQGEIQQKSEKIRETMHKNIDTSRKDLLAFGREKGLSAAQTERRMKQIGAAADVLFEGAVDFDFLAANDPREFVLAVRAVDDYLKQAGEHALHRSLVNEPTGSVESGFEVMAALGDYVPVQPRPGEFRYDPTRLSRQRRAADQESGGAIRKALGAPESTNPLAGLTSNGKPIHVDDATGARQRREQELRDARARTLGIPKSL